MKRSVIPHIDKMGTAGLFLTALLSPCCFPLFAFVATTLGLGNTELFGGWTMWIFQAMVLLSVAGLSLSYRKHRYPYPLLTAVTGAILILYAYHFNDSDQWTYFLYAGMFLLLAATLWNMKRNTLHNSCESCVIDNSKTVELMSTITCPVCGHQKEEQMPTDSCVFFYECTQCRTRLKPLAGDCCVFCSYGNRPCPPIQAGNNCC